MFYCVQKLLLNCKSKAAISLILFFMTSFAHATTPTELAAEAEALARAGDMPAALERMQQAADALWGLQDLTLVKSGFKSEALEPDILVLQSGDAFTAFASLTGFGYEENDAELSVAFSVDLEIRHLSGRVLARREGFATVKEPVSKRLSEFTLEMQVQTPALLDGQYEAAFVVTDLASNQSRPFSLNFTIDGVKE